MAGVIDPDWPGLNGLTLTKGAHQAGTGAYCFAEAVVQHGYQTFGESWDAASISLPLRQAGQRINDGVDDSTRQLLKTSIDAVMRSSNADAALEKRRQYVLLDGMVHQFAPAWLDYIGRQQDATTLRNRPQVKDAASAQAVSSGLRSTLVQLRFALASKSAVVGPPTSYSYRGYEAVIDGGGLAYVLASDLPAETLIRSVDKIQGNVDKTTAERTVFGMDANGNGGWPSTIGLLAVGTFRQAVAAT